MRKSLYIEEQIVLVLRQAEHGTPMPKIIKKGKFEGAKLNWKDSRQQINRTESYLAFLQLPLKYCANVGDSVGDTRFRQNKKDSSGIPKSLFINHVGDGRLELPTSGM